MSNTISYINPQHKDSDIIQNLKSLLCEKSSDNYKTEDEYSSFMIDESEDNIKNDIIGAMNGKINITNFSSYITILPVNNRSFVNVSSF